VLHLIVTLRASEAAAQCIVIAPVCAFVCLFVGPPYYSQRAVFASPLSAFSFSVCSLCWFSCQCLPSDWLERLL